MKTQDRTVMLLLVALSALHAAGAVAPRYQESKIRITESDRQDIQSVIDFEQRFYDLALGDANDSGLNIKTFGQFNDYRSYLKTVDATYSKTLPEEIRANMPGRYYPLRKEAVVLYDKTFKSTVCHEVSHFLLLNRYPRPPMWLNEGLAAYFGQARIEKGRLIVHDARCPVCGRSHSWESLNQWMEDNALMSISYLLNVDHATWHMAGDRVCELYTLSWSVIHYLMDSEAGIGILITIMRDMRAGMDPLTAVDRNYPGGIRRLETDWRRHILERTPEPDSPQIPRGRSSP